MEKEQEPSTFGGICMTTFFIFVFIVFPIMSVRQCEKESREKAERKRIQEQRNLKKDFICIDKKEEIAIRKYMFSSASYTRYAVIFKTNDGEVTVKYVDSKECSKYEIGKIYHFKDI